MRQEGSNLAITPSLQASAFVYPEWEAGWRAGWPGTGPNLHFAWWSCQNLPLAIVPGRHGSGRVCVHAHACTRSRANTHTCWTVLVLGTKFLLIL